MIHGMKFCLPKGARRVSSATVAAREAAGDILYFLDDDSLIHPENLALCSDGMSDPAVAVVGGPSITPAGDSWLQQLFGDALASAFGSGAVHNRYRAHGETRVTTDKELILCNLAVRRSLFIELGGFNECLYPNEENEFLERVTSAGYTLLHAPSMSVSRSQRRTLKAFIRQMFNYGRGRGAADSDHLFVFGHKFHTAVFCRISGPLADMYKVCFTARTSRDISVCSRSQLIRSAVSERPPVVSAPDRPLSAYALS